MKSWLVILWGGAVMAALVALMLSTAPAPAQQQVCGPLADVLKRLEQKFKEFVVMEGLAPNGRVIVTRADGGSWSVVSVQKESDIACLMATGEESHFDVGL